MIKERPKSLLELINREKITELVTNKKEFISLLDKKIELIIAIERVKTLITPASMNTENTEKVLEALKRVKAGLEKIKQITKEQKILSKHNLKITFDQELELIKRLIENIQKGIDPHLTLDIQEFSDYLKLLEKTSYLLELNLK